MALALSCYLILTLVALLSSVGSAFSLAPTARGIQEGCNALFSTRRDVLTSVLVIGGATGLAWNPPTAVADDVEDLAMPTSEEQQKLDEAAAMEAKIKRKLELQKKASRPQAFTENFKGEMERQKEFKQQSKEERRNAMCEELGRGC
ncbi:hypothetical protein ACA910_000834 [Epithemia clementina (nom. ined.)]